MSETHQLQNAGTAPGSGAARHPGADLTKSTAWVGWVIFGGVMMVMVGGFQAALGLVALFNDNYFLFTRNGLLVTADYTTWGWVHLTLGALVVIAGCSVMAGQTWARVVAIILAVVSAIVNVGFLAAYPVWSIIVITLDVIVIYAMAVHGREAKLAY
jgi:hypothetical protein